MRKTQSQKFQTLFSWADKHSLSEDVFPRDVDKLLSVAELNLHTKNLDFIPSEISLLQNLEKLYLSDNDLAVLPKEIGKLKNLKVLWIQSNKLSVLPNELLNLELLEELVAFDNMLEELPKRIADMSSLKALFLHNNCLKKNNIESELYPLKDTLELSIYNQHDANQLKEIYSIFLSGTEDDINIDKDDLNTMINYAGTSLIIKGSFNANDTGFKALTALIDLEYKKLPEIITAKGIAIQFYTHKNYLISDICTEVGDVQEYFNNSDLLFGILTDEKLSTDSVEVTVLLTGISASA
ncbi:MAG: leucine-rich repeat domain-containing protein [Sulfurimonas sp.]|jgi:Leucine-rich repeat (LRR) protein